MKFSNNNPVENENITINLTLFNSGNADSGPFKVQFFEGNYTAGNQINGNITVSGVKIGENITINTSWIAKIGRYNIQAVIDPPFIQNGTIWEINETNNIVNNEIVIPSYHIYYGNTSSVIKLEKSDNSSQFIWNLSNQGKIYVTESGSSVNWLTLQALGRNISNSTAFNDFFEADLFLRIENYTDSINNTYTSQQQPVFENNITVYSKTIKYVPFINSTNSSMFQTGILWDTSDGNTQYNGSQDLVFLTQIAHTQIGKFGMVDYEIRIPSTLATYKLISGRVTFYTEII
jgi:hypothetical protein